MIRKVSFWSLSIGARFRDDETMWGFIKISWCRVQLVDTEIKQFFAPWIKVELIEDQPNED